jgi:quercetin dioxygenase-like cupin family protein
MRIIEGGETSEVYGGRFTGAVTLEMLDAAPADGAPDIARVSFADGACTFWHRHPGGQKLLVLSGRGRIGDEDGETILEPGTYVDTEPLHRHYHGAAPGSDCVLLAITWGTTAWEDVGP